MEIDAVSVLGSFLQQQKLSYAAGAAVLNELAKRFGGSDRVWSETLRRWSQDPEHPDFRQPRRAALRLLHVFTKGALDVGPFVAAPAIDGKTARLVDDLIAKHRAAAAQAAHQGRAKGAKGAARARAVRAHVKRGAR